MHLVKHPELIRFPMTARINACPPSVRAPGKHELRGRCALPEESSHAGFGFRAEDAGSLHDAVRGRGVKASGSRLRV